MRCGVDMVEIDRIKHCCDRPSFLNKIFTEQEREFFSTLKNPYPSIAANFAVKEALVKALGTGFRQIFPSDISVLRDSLGAPYILSANPNIQLPSAAVSITHTDQLATAFVIIEE